MNKFVILICIFLFALIPRIYDLPAASIYPDEVIWMVRSKEAFFALKQLNFKYFENGWWNLNKSTEAIGFPLVTITGPFLVLLGQGQSKFSLNLLSDISSARLPIAIFNSLFLVGFFLMIRKMFNQKLAFLATVLFSLDPIYLGLSRSLMQDTLLMIFSFIALSSFLLIKKLRFAFIIALSMTTAAYLTKPQGLIVLIAPIILFIKQQLKLKRLLLFFFLLIILIAVFWPGNWSSPSLSFLTYPLNQFTISGQGMRNFFLGEITYNPSPFYYIFQIFVRLPLLISLFILISPLFFWNKLKKLDLKIFIIFIYCLLYLLIMTLSAKKLGPRYILPLWPWLYILASWTILKILEKIKLETIKIIFLVLIFGGGLWSTIYYFPEYSLFYNSLIGGSQMAAKYDLAGLCLGAKPSFEYINKYYPKTKSVSYIGCGEVLSPYYYPKKLTKDFQKAELVIVEGSFKQLLPNDEKMIYFNKFTPIATIEEKGVVLANIYHFKDATKTMVPDL